MPASDPDHRFRQARKTAKRDKPSPGSEPYRHKAFRLALIHCPGIFPCLQCGWPVVKGTQCGCGGYGDENNADPFMG
jgi:hypothetical protein